jgi:hypothetical protein
MDCVDFRTFLESVPPLDKRFVSLDVHEFGPRPSLKVEVPPIYLYCPDKDCRGLRFYDYQGSEIFLPEGKGVYKQYFLFYRCRNCKLRQKTYAVRITRSADEYSVQTIVKLGELPRYGEPRPNVVTDVLDDEIGYFDFGYRAETDGLGIGAFAYYRRFVESHKDKIIAEIRKVAVAQNLSPSIIETLDSAAKKREFSSAVEEIKDAIPDSLKINGANPLTLLAACIMTTMSNAWR